MRLPQHEGPQRPRPERQPGRRRIDGLRVIVGEGGRGALARRLAVGEEREQIALVGEEDPSILARVLGDQAFSGRAQSHGISSGGRCPRVGETLSRTEEVFNHVAIVRTVSLRCMSADAPEDRINRGERRKAQTRARLLDAARTLFAAQGVDATRITEITDTADVGAGSFYNHFADKDELVAAILADLAERQGALVDRITHDLDDPAAIVAYAHRHFVRLAREDATFGNLVVRLDLSHRLLMRALGPRAVRDVEAGVAAGRFEVPDVVLAVYGTGGALLGTIRAVLDGATGPDADRHHAEGVLRALGVPASEAAEIARRPLPLT
ncbi:MAG TPA: TetR family transcriptional regulator [Conexibacter sp.]|nr:TetR family transcriptional regulator [Conexibacter sp.]